MFGMNIFDVENEEKRKAVTLMFNAIARHYDFLNRLLSFGMDRYWRKKAVRIIARKYENPYILDVATGTADLAIAAVKMAGATVVGMDISEKMLELGKEKINTNGLSESIHLIQADAEKIPFPDEHFDAVMVAFGVRNFPDPAKGLSEMHRVLQNSGMIVVLEFSKPLGFPFRLMYHFYFQRVLPLIGRLFSGEKEAYRYLPDSVRRFPDGEGFLKMLIDAGFSETHRIRLTGGVASISTGLKQQCNQVMTTQSR